MSPLRINNKVAIYCDYYMKPYTQLTGKYFIKAHASSNINFSVIQQLVTDPSSFVFSIIIFSMKLVIKSTTKAGQMTHRVPATC